MHDAARRGGLHLAPCTRTRLDALRCNAIISQRSITPPPSIKHLPVLATLAFLPCPTPYSHFHSSIAFFPTIIDPFSSPFTDLLRRRRDSLSSVLFATRDGSCLALTFVEETGGVLRIDFLSLLSFLSFGEPSRGY